MRCPPFVLALLLCATTARADPLADLRKSSSTIAGHVTDWGPFGTGSGAVEPTCERKAALAEWNERAAAVNVVCDTLLNASNWPDKADPRAVMDAPNACVGAADAMGRLHHAKQSRMDDFANALAWMRPWFERQKLPIPASIGASFRTMAGALDQPNLLRQARKALYDQAVFATRDVQQQTDDAVRAAHVAVLQAAVAIETGPPQQNAAAAIVAAAGPGFQAIAQKQARQLDQSSPRTQTRAATWPRPAAPWVPSRLAFCGSWRLP